MIWQRQNKCWPRTKKKEGSLRPDAPKAEDDQAAEKAHVIVAYLEAESVNGRLRHVLHPEETGPRMEKHYKFYDGAANLRDIRDIEVVEIKRIDGQGDPKVGEYGKYKTTLIDQGIQYTHIYYVKNTQEGMKIDWETSTGWNEMSLIVFKNLRPPGSAKIFRLKARLGSYEPHPGLAYSYHNILLFSNDPFSELHGYVKKESKLGQRLFDVLKDGETHALTLQIGLSSPADPNDRTAGIYDLISEDWLIR